MEHACPPGWVPRSPCTPGCLPSPSRTRGPLLVAARLAGLVVVVLGAPLPAGRARWSRRCSRGALRAAGVVLRVTGDVRFADTGGVLVVANHVSWLDVLALDAVAPVRMLAKREVRDWPVVGALARRAGAVFVDRAGLRTLPATVAATAEALRAGAAVGVFPEGTTWCGTAAGPFRRAAFQAAIDAAVPVRPVAITYTHADGAPARVAAFVGEQTLLDSLLRVLGRRGLVCEVRLLPLITDVADRRELARRAGAAVGAVTGTAHPAGRPVDRRLTSAA